MAQQISRWQWKAQIRRWYRSQFGWVVKTKPVPRKMAKKAQYFWPWRNIFINWEESKWGSHGIKKHVYKHYHRKCYRQLNFFFVFWFLSVWKLFLVQYFLGIRLTTIFSLKSQQESVPIFKLNQWEIKKNEGAGWSGIQWNAATPFIIRYQSSIGNGFISNAISGRTNTV